MLLCRVQNIIRTYIPEDDPYPGCMYKESQNTPTQMSNNVCLTAVMTQEAQKRTETNGSEVPCPPKEENKRESSA